jgi:hypothetical protein
VGNSSEASNKTTDKTEVKKAAGNASANASASNTTEKAEEKLPTVIPEQGHDVKSTNWNTNACDGYQASCTSGGYYGLASKKDVGEKNHTGRGDSGEADLPICNGANSQTQTLNCARHSLS